jgi:hypothetical protein
MKKAPFRRIHDLDHTKSSCSQNNPHYRKISILGIGIVGNEYTGSGTKWDKRLHLKEIQGVNLILHMKKGV